ncbi:putative membrane protein [Nocardioides luteus]|uniref:DUF2306 domain-containing protein n=1 Tax=Nocardioides luteus TaxID=1844 RepID=A0ABQ5T0G7_9ACTN|nr:DUF2306 domain-containing protein [Nocardioides luteus]MDR7312394.1 putative membrane protein [Nocardioides luteus]GGR58194.1 hypothetical protein GCM10010197_26190 [Nocardioides luteus]GLJ68641.1 hypothetical protein GCM10017579_26770 [Nocardioides luteus]
MRSSNRPLLNQWWVFPLAATTVIFLVTALPRYVGLDPSQSLSPTDRGAAFYPALVTHIFFGSVMLTCGVLQLWPWLRAHHPTVHRWSGRAYVATGIPTAVAALVTSQFPAAGPAQQVGNTFGAALLLLCTVQGYRAARQRRFKDHRAWMYRSYALAFSIVVNRFWGVALIILYVPEVMTNPDLSPADPTFASAAAASAWVSWVVNLLIAEWIIQRTSRRRAGSRNRQASASRSVERQTPVSSSSGISTVPPS